MPQFYTNKVRLSSNIECAYADKSKPLRPAKSCGVLKSYGGGDQNYTAKAIVAQTNVAVLEPAK
jgi:hypothetical protein